MHTIQAEHLQFRQSPTFEDCFPSSEKCYKEVEFNGETLRVCSHASCRLCCFLYLDPFAGLSKLCIPYYSSSSRSYFACDGVHVQVLVCMASRLASLRQFAKKTTWP
jgi:hypothetical protein